MIGVHDVPPAAADALSEIHRLYREMQALPKPDHPNPAGTFGNRTPRGSARYRALERRMYRLTRPFWPPR